MDIGFDRQRYRWENWDRDNERRRDILRTCALHAVMTLLHVTFSSRRTGVEILDDQFLGQIRAPFEKPLSRDSTRDTANNRSLELCTSIEHVFLDDWSV
jgi:hypothetical protein